MIEWEREAAVGCQKCWVAMGECCIWWKFTQEPVTFTHWRWGPRAAGICCPHSHTAVPPPCHCPERPQPEKLNQKMSWGAVQDSRQSGLPGQPPWHEAGYCLDGPTALPDLWWLLASGGYLLLIWLYSCCFWHMVLKWDHWVQLTHAWGCPTWRRQVAKVTSQVLAFSADGLCLLSS